MTLRRRTFVRSGTVYVRTTCAILGSMVDVFEALCFLEGRRPHELVADIVLDRLREAAIDPVVMAAVAARLPDPPAGHLRVVK